MQSDHSVAVRPSILSAIGLRLALKADAVVSGAIGVVFAAGASTLADPLGLPTALLAGVGGFLVAYAAAVWLIASRAEISRPAAKAVVAFNVLWVVDSLALIALDWGSPSVAGQVVVAFQAAGVAMFAAVQVLALRKAVD